MASKITGDQSYLQGVCEYDGGLLLVHGNRGKEAASIYFYKDNSVTLKARIQLNRPAWGVTEHEPEGIQVFDNEIYVGVVYTLPLGFKLNTIQKLGEL